MHLEYFITMNRNHGNHYAYICKNNHITIGAYPLGTRRISNVLRPVGNDDSIY